MTVLLEYIDLQLIFSSQRSCKSDFYHVCTLSHSASCKIGRVSASHITNAQKFCLICWHYADAFGLLLCPKLCWRNRHRPASSTTACMYWLQSYNPKVFTLHQRTGHFLICIYVYKKIVVSTLVIDI